jgi:hypothetical protein
MTKLVWLWGLLLCSAALAQPAPPPTSAPPAPTPAPTPAPVPTPTPATTPATGTGSGSGTGSAAPPPAPAPAADPDTEAAKLHFTQGVALFNDGNYVAALAEFEQSNKLKPAPFVLKNIGLTQKALFRYAEAIASLEQYLAQSPTLTPEEKAEANQLITEMQALLADVTLTGVPDGATISVDGREIAKAPLTKPLAVAAGSHTVEAAADGYEPAKKTFMVAAKVPATIKLDMKVIPKTGKVRISSSVPHATVLIDGKEQDATKSLELGIGGHTLEVSAPGYETHREELTIAGGQDREIPVTLDKVKVVEVDHWYAKWYFWTPIAVVAAGGVALYAVTRHDDPLQGTLAPGAGGIQ